MWQIEIAKSIIMPVNLGAVDLKLLVVFDAVMAERNVSLAGARIGMSQSATSNALNRLRELLADQLFVRTGSGMQPTPFALRLATPVRQALQLFQSALEPSLFDPSSSTWTYRLAISDHASIVMLPDLTQRLARIAPGVRLVLRPKVNAEVAEQLDANEVDFAIGVIPPLPRRFSRVPLFRDSYDCVLRRNHPLATRPLKLADFKTAEFLAVRPRHEGASEVDRLLAAHGVRRTIAITVDQFLAAPPIVAHTNLIAFMLRGVMRHLDLRQLHIAAAPLRLDVQVVAVWNRALTKQNAHSWMRHQLIDVSRGLHLEPRAERPSQPELAK
jgi:DNA-binding transcriptional LysR family regulator